MFYTLAIYNFLFPRMYAISTLSAPSICNHSASDNGSGKYRHEILGMTMLGAERNCVE
jgi:hypothetical protein